MQRKQRPGRARSSKICSVCSVALLVSSAVLATPVRAQDTRGDEAAANAKGRANVEEKAEVNVDAKVEADKNVDKNAETSAEAKVAEARKAFERGDYQQSLGSLREAQTLYPSPKLHFNFGLVFKALGRDVDALAAFTRFLSEAPGASADRRAEAERQVSELRGRVAWLDVASDADGAEVFVDGRSYGKTPLSTAVVVAPGPHQIVVQKDGQANPYTDRIEARPGAEIRIQARIFVPPIAVQAPPAPAPAALTASVPPPTPSPPFYKRWWVWTGAAAVVGGTVATFVLLGSRDSGNICSDCNAGVFKVPGK